jgi:hypothetical protein
MSPSEMEAYVLDLGFRVAGVGLFLPELTARVKRLEEDRQSTYTHLHSLERKIEEQASVIASLQKP